MCREPRKMPRFPNVPHIKVNITDKKLKKPIHSVIKNFSDHGIFLSLKKTLKNSEAAKGLCFKEKSIRIINKSKDVWGDIKWFKEDKGEILLGVSLEDDISKIGLEIPINESQISESTDRLSDEDIKKYSDYFRENVKYKKDKSLYKYLQNVLDIADQFVCSDIAFIGLVIKHGNKKVIAISDTVLQGNKKEYLKMKSQSDDSVFKDKESGLLYLETNPILNKRKNCMARCYLNYKNKKNEEPILTIYEGNKKLMTSEEKKYCDDNWFAKIHASITAELTVPIVVDGEVKIILNFETTAKTNRTFNPLTKKLLKSFAKAIGEDDAFKKTIYKAPDKFCHFLYHAAIHHILGEYKHAANEFKVWREVQCQDIFLNYHYPVLRDLFHGFKGFYKLLCDDSLSNKKRDKLIDKGLSSLFVEKNPKKLKFVPFYMLLEIHEKINQLGSEKIKKKEMWNEKSDNLFQLMKDKEMVPTRLRSLSNKLSDIAIGAERNSFTRLINKQFKGNGVKNNEKFVFYKFYLNLCFLIGVVELNKIYTKAKEALTPTFEEFKVESDEDKEKINDFIITCSLLIMSEEIEYFVEKNKTLSIPLILAHIYRGEAFFLLENKRKAYNDFSRLEHLIESFSIHNFQFLPAINQDEDINKRAVNFKEWIKILTKYQKGKVYAASYAYRKALNNFCQMMDKYEKFHKKVKGLPFQQTIIDAMIYKGKLFLEAGSFQRSLKWFLRALRDVFNEGWKENKKTNSYRIADQLLEDLINKLEDFKHDDIIKKDELIEKLFVTYSDIRNVINYLNNKKENKNKNINFTDIKYWKEKIHDTKNKKRILLTDCLFFNIENYPTSNKKILSDLSNRIGFLIFLIHLYDGNNNLTKRISLKNSKGRIDIAAEWIEVAIKFDANNGVATLNKLLFKFAQGNLKKTAEINDDFNISFSNLKRFYRRFYPVILKSIYNKYTSFPKKKLDKVAYEVMRYLLTYTDEMIKKPAEIYSYLSRDGWINKGEKGEKGGKGGKGGKAIDGIYSLERWSSWSPTVPRPRMFSVRGGGKLLIWKGKGIAIDPGFDFLTNLYEEGFSLMDIDAICITHNHSDHTQDFDSICRLIKEYNTVIEKEKKLLTLLVNPGFLQNCHHYLKEAKDKGEIEHVYVLSYDTKINLDDFKISIEVLRASHSDQHTEDYSVGFIFELRDNDKGEPLKIGFTGDSKFVEYDGKFRNDMEKLSSCQIVFANLSHATFRELKGILNIDLKSTGINGFDDFIKNLKKEERKKIKNEQDISAISTIQILKWALWYGHGEKIDDLLKKEPIEEQMQRKNQTGEIIKGKGVLAGHLGVTGINKIREILTKSSAKDKSATTQTSNKLLVISEFREELGSFRYKLAQLLNKHFQEDNVHCCTADIGMSIRFEKRKDSYEIKTQCSFCKQDNDLNIGTTPYHPSTFHPSTNIEEVCVKGENEGIFYFCKNHLPGNSGQFLEGVDRFSLFSIE